MREVKGDMESAHVIKMSIGGVGVELNSPFPLYTNGTSGLFVSHYDKQYDRASSIPIEIALCDSISAPNAAPDYASSFVEVYTTPNGCVTIRKHPKTGAAFAMFVDNVEQSKHMLYIKESVIEDERELNRLLLYICLPHLLLTRGRIMLHSSYICYKGNGIIFIGASGAGKSTQAELWRKHSNVSVINGDRVILSRDVATKTVTAYSMPYSGTSGICKNMDTKLSGIVIPIKANKTIGKRVYGIQAVKPIIENAVVENWRSGEEATAILIACSIAEAVPVILLECLPDISAVETVQQMLLNHII